MPSPGSLLRSPRSRIFLAALVAIALAAYAFINVGRFFTREDPLRQADAIAVLAGTRMNRALEAADLYRRGWAPRLVLTRGRSERAFAVLAGAGIPLDADIDVTRHVLEKLGVPAAAIIVPPRVHDNTAQEAQTLRQLAALNGWQRIVVVTSKYHLRRAGFAVRRELRGTGTEVMMHGTRYEDVNPERWWTSRADWRWVYEEAGKLLAYTLGLGA